MAGEFWLNDRQWTRLQPLLPNKPRGVHRVDDRRVISGIVHVLQSGCQRKDAPAIYGPPKTLYNRNVRWAAKGVWRDVFEALAAEGGPPTEVLIDSTHVTAHRSAAGGKGGARSGDGRQPEWPQHQGPRHHRSPRPTARFTADARPSRRPLRRRAPAERLAPALHCPSRPRL